MSNHFERITLSRRAFFALRSASYAPFPRTSWQQVSDEHFEVLIDGETLDELSDFTKSRGLSLSDAIIALCSESNDLLN